MRAVIEKAAQVVGKMTSPELMWSPSGDATNMDVFRERVNQKFSLSLGTLVRAECE